MSSARPLLFVLVVWTEIAVAASTPVQVQLEVRSALDCGSEAKLVERVRMRSPRIQFVDSSGDVVVGVTFAERSGGFAGEVAWLEAGKRTNVRRLMARSCEEAVEGVALILAITLDPNAISNIPAVEPSTSSADTEGSSPTTPNVSGDGASTSPKAPPEPTPQLETTASVVARPSTPPKDPQRAATEPPQQAPNKETEPQPNPYVVNDDWFVGGTLAGEFAFGVAPAAMPGVGAYLLFGLERPSVWAPALMVGGLWTWGPTSEQPEGNADFDLAALSFDLCAARLRWLKLELRTCAAGLVGRFSASASNTLNSVGVVTRPMVALGAAALLHLRISPHVELFGRLAPRANLVRDEYEFGSRMFHRVGPLTVSASVGFGGRLP